MKARPTQVTARRGVRSGKRPCGRRSAAPSAHGLFVDNVMKELVSISESLVKTVAGE
jgi:hypothetical protein